MVGKLTKRLVESIAPAEKDSFVWDTDLKGFGLKVSPAGKRIYVLQTYVGGRLKRLTVGEHGPLTCDQARAEVLRLKGKIAGGADPAQEKAEVKKAPTVADLAQRYLEEHAEAKKKPASVAEDRRMLAGFILPALGSRKVSAVSRGDVAKLHHALRETPYQANRVLALLGKMFSLCEKWGLRPDGSNPVKHVEKFREQKRERFLGGDELARLGAALSEAEALGQENPYAVAAIRLLLLTGCRRNEILSLRWHEVDFERACLRLPDSKTGARLVPLNGPALEVLAAIPRLEGNPYVIPGDRPGAHLVNLRKPWSRIQQRAGLDWVRLHDLRHSHAAVGVAAGLGLPLIGGLLGHTQPSTTAKYAHLSNDPLRIASEEIGRRIAEAMSRPPAAPKVVALRKGVRVDSC
jgi:integrase